MITDTTNTLRQPGIYCAGTADHWRNVHPAPGSYGPWSMRCGQCSQTLSQGAAKKHRMWGHICADREACAARRAR